MYISVLETVNVLQEKGETSLFTLEEFGNYFVNIHSLVLVYVEYCHLSLIVLRGGVFSLLMPLKLCSVAQVDTEKVSETRATYIPG